MTGSIDQLSEAIGQLRAQVREQGEDITQLFQLIREDQRVQGGALSDMREAVASLHNTLTMRAADQETRLARAEQTLREHEKLKLQGEGATWIAKGLFVAVGGGIAVLISKLFDWFYHIK